MTAGARIAVVDYGMGNLRSVEKALERVGARPEVTSEPERIGAADGLVLPGVGAFPEAVAALRRLGLDAVLETRARDGAPLLGICLGMQLLFESSEEHGGAAGLGLLEGAVVRLPADGLKLPQIGWNAVSWRRRSPVTERLPDPCAFYHVHTYAPVPASDADVLGTATYGAPFASAVERGRVTGVQFHPEKSGTHGLELLAGFAAACAG